MDVIWRALSNCNKPSHSSALAAPASVFSNSSNASISSAQSNMESDSFFSISEEKFNGSFGGGNTEIDDVFVGIGQVSTIPTLAPKHTSEEMRLLHLGHLYLVFDFVDTDLSKIIRSNQYMTKGHVQFILYQLLLGLKYMHSMNVIHRDIKPANILVSCVDCSVKIADFGLARVVEANAVARDYGYESKGESELPSKDDDSDADCTDLDGSMDVIPQIPSPLPDHLFLDKQNQNQNQSSTPTVPKVILKRAMTKHVVSHASYALSLL
jgi:serine/threonine protein kinase